MNKSLITVLSSIALMMAGAPAGAHHSTAVYDFSKYPEMSGTVKVIQAVNPHLMLILVVNDASGSHEVEFEGQSLNHFYRFGWRKGMINAGDQITVSYAPRRDGKQGGYVNALLTPAGQWIRVGPPPPSTSSTPPLPTPQTP